MPWCVQGAWGTCTFNPLAAALSSSSRLWTARERHTEGWLCEYWSYEQMDDPTAGIRRLRGLYNELSRDPVTRHTRLRESVRLQVNPPSYKRRSVFRWVLTVTRSCCCGLSQARFSCGTELPSSARLAPGFITDPPKVPSGSKTSGSNREQRTQQDTCTGTQELTCSALCVDGWNYGSGLGVQRVPGHVLHAVTERVIVWEGGGCSSVRAAGGCSLTHTQTWWWWWWWWSVKGKVALRWALLSPGRRV